MKYLFDALEKRLSEFPALVLKGRKLYVGFGEENVNATKPYTELNAKLARRLDTFAVDVEEWDLDFRYHADANRSTDADDWIDGMTDALKNANVMSGNFQTVQCSMTDASVPKLTDGLFDAAIGFKLIIQKDRTANVAEEEPVIVPATVTFSLTKDAFLRDTSPTTNFGNNENLKLGVGVNTAGTIDRPLIHVDLSAVPASGSIIPIPDGATITAAHIEFTYLNPGGSGTVKIRRLTQSAWVELQATWNRYATGLDWALAGGDFTTALEVDWPKPTAADTNPVSTTDLAILVQDALDSRSKQLHLILMMADEITNGNNITFRDSEYNPIPSQRPSLSVSYE